MYTIEEFRDYIAQNLGAWLPGKYKGAPITFREITRSTGKATGIFPELSHDPVELVPVFYVEQLYDSYISGMGPEDILRHVADSFKQGCDSRMQSFVTSIPSLDDVRKGIVMSLMNRTAGGRRLEEMPHRLIGDMALYYRVVCSAGEDGTYSANIGSSLLDIWGITEKELHDLALANSRTLLPPFISTLDKVLEKASADRSLPDALYTQGPEDFYVISNTSFSYGASAFLYSTYLSDLAGAYKRDILIIPSSIHEILAVPEENLSCQALGRMLREVNDTQLEKQEILSYNIYRYCADTGEIDIADRLRH